MIGNHLFPTLIECRNSEKSNARKHHTAKNLSCYSQQMLSFSQHFAEKFCLENACGVMFTDICCHLTDMTFLGVISSTMMKCVVIMNYLFQ